MALINTTTTGVLGTTVYGDGSGALTVQQNGVTQGIYGNIPAFSAYQSVQQTSVGSGATTKITFTTVEFDTNSNFASSRFTPTVAGYYQINASIQIAYGTSTAAVTSIIGKNGSSYKGGNLSQGNAVAGGIFANSTVSALVYCNGSTDYVEIFAYGSNNGSAYNIQNGQAATWFQGILVKAA
jgi:hypothetical protein